MPGLKDLNQRLLVEVGVQLLRDAIALASRGLEESSVRDFHPSLLVFKEPASLHGPGYVRDGSSLGSKHLCEKLLREIQNLRLSSILRHQDPACQPCFRLMEPVAAGHLADNKRLLLNKFQDSIVNLIRCSERSPQGGKFDPKTGSSQLHKATRLDRC